MIHGLRLACLFWHTLFTDCGREAVEHHRAEMNLPKKVLIVLLCVIGTDMVLRRYVVRRLTEYAPPQDASPCTKRLSEIERQWMHCFGGSVELFLSADYKLPEDAFNWWKVRRRLTRKQPQPFTRPSSFFVCLTIGCYHATHNRRDSNARFVRVPAFTAWAAQLQCLQWDSGQAVWDDPTQSRSERAPPRQLQDVFSGGEFC